MDTKHGQTKIGAVAFVGGKPSNVENRGGYTSQLGTLAWVELLAISVDHWATARDTRYHTL